jgi:hypothetical protein
MNKRLRNLKKVNGGMMTYKYRRRHCQEYTSSKRPEADGVTGFSSRTPQGLRI